MGDKRIVQRGSGGAMPGDGEPEPVLERISRSGVCVVRVDRDTVVLESVPVDPAEFNKPHSNLLVQRHRLTGRYIVFVDADLECTVAGARRRRALKSRSEKNGWRPLLLRGMPATLPEAVRGAFELLGSPPLDTAAVDPEGPAVVVESEPDEFFLRHTIDLTEQALRAGANATIGRDAEMHLVLATLRKYDHPRMPVVTGPSGCGKTALLLGIAATLATHRNVHGLAGNTIPQRLLEVDYSRLFTGALFPGEREDGLKRLLDAAPPHHILAIEDLYTFAVLCPKGILLLEHALDAGTGVIATTRMLPTRSLFRASFRRRMIEVALPEIDSLQCFHILDGLKDELERHHGIEIPESVLRFVVSQSEDLPGVFPASAIDLLDTTCAMLSCTNGRTVALDDVLDSLAVCGMRDGGREVDEEGEEHDL